MSDHLDKTIADLQRHLTDLEDQTIDTKKAINSLCRVNGKSAIYTDLERSEVPTLNGKMNGDEYYGKALATVVREILVARKDAGLGPATVNELFATMTDGGYLFEAKTADNSKRGLRISLAKNTSTFHKLPNGKFGLSEWYPAAKSPTNGNGKKASKPTDFETADDAVFDELFEPVKPK